MTGIPPPGIAAVRGAVAIPIDSRDAIRKGTARLLRQLMDSNGIAPADIVSALFTATDDLVADFPAHAARTLGWTDVPLLCAREIAVAGAMPRVVRVMLTVSGVAPGRRLVPAYLDGAAALRPDLEPPDVSSPVATRRVALIGLGQIGGSIGLALGARSGWFRLGFDQDPAVVKRARAMNAIDEAADSVATCCAGADLAVVAIPVDELPAVLDQVAAALPAGASLVDTGSARAGVSAALERASARGLRAVGGHPIAGREGHGLDAARRDLFQGATFALMPVGEEIPAPVVDLVRDLGARAMRVSPADHDHALARTSHLPYLVACALRALGEGAAREGLSGPGFRDATRLAGSEPRMALAYCRANVEEITAAWRELRASIDAGIDRLGRAGA